MSVSVDLHRFADEVREIPRSGMIAAAKAAKKLVNDAGSSVAGADGLKGKKKRGLKLRSRDEIKVQGDMVVCRVQGTVPGWVWVNTGTRAHTIRRRKRGKKRKMLVHHPGTHGRGEFDKVAAKVAELVPLIFDDAVAEAVRRA